MTEIRDKGRPIRSSSSSSANVGSVFTAYLLVLCSMVLNVPHGGTSITSLGRWFFRLIDLLQMQPPSPLIQKHMAVAFADIFMDLLLLYFGIKDTGSFYLWRQAVSQTG